jgi:hypothetical protein
MNWLWSVSIWINPGDGRTSRPLSCCQVNSPALGHWAWQDAASWEVIWFLPLSGRGPGQRLAAAGWLPWWLPGRRGRLGLGI